MIKERTTKKRKISIDTTATYITIKLSYHASVVLYVLNLLYDISYLSIHTTANIYYEAYELLGYLSVKNVDPYVAIILNEFEQALNETNWYGLLIKSFRDKNQLFFACILNYYYVKGRTCPNNTHQDPLADLEPMHMAYHQLFVIYRDKINELRQTIKDLQQTTTNLRVRIDILEEKN